MCGAGQASARGEVREHLIASVRAGGDHGRGLELLDQLLEARGPRRRRVCGEAIVIDDMHRYDAVGTQSGDGFADRERVDRTAEVARKGHGLERELLTGLHQDEDAHPATPISRMSSTTRGAASGPVPRISACLP